MDPATIALSAVTLLTPYVKDAGQELVKTIGDVGVRKVKDLLGLLKDRFASDPAAAQDLSRFEREPDKRADDLKETIAAKVQADPAFAGELAQHVDNLGPVIVAVQEFNELRNATNVSIGTMGSGKLTATQKGQVGDNVTNVRIDKL
jgi:hypothetical protein